MTSYGPGATDAFEAPERFGDKDRYQRVEMLGQGSFAPVWQYVDRVAGRPTAVKFLSYADNAMPPMQEIKALGGARHPNLVTLYDVMPVADRHGRMRTAMIMELIDGTSLADVIRTRGPIAPPQLLDWADQIASALDHLHGKLVHGDLHSRNVLLDTGLTRAAIKIADLGTSTRLGEPSNGRLDVQAPEAWRAATGASDYWAVGLLLAQLGAGRALAVRLGTRDSASLAHGVREQALQLAEGIEHRPTVALIEDLLRIDPAHRAGRARIAEVRARLATDAHAGAAAGRRPSSGPRMPRMRAARARLPRPSWAPVRALVAHLQAARRLQRLPAALAARLPHLRLRLRPPARPAVAGALLLAACGAVGGFFAAGGAAPSTTPPASVTAGSMRLPVAAPWSLTRSRPGPEHVRLTGTVSLAYRPIAGATLTAGRLADGLVARQLREDPPGRVRVGTLVGLRYPLRRLDASHTSWLFLVPTSAGYATFACVAPASRAHAFAPVCAGLVARARVVGARRGVPGPDRRYAQLLQRALARAARVRGRSALNSSSLDERAAAARSVADAYGALRRTLTAHAPPLEARAAADALVRASGRQRTAFDALARAAARADGAAYSRAAMKIARETVELTRAVTALRAIGYDVRVR